MRVTHDGRALSGPGDLAGKRGTVWLSIDDTAAPDRAAIGWTNALGLFALRGGTILQR